MLSKSRIAFLFTCILTVAVFFAPAARAEILMFDLSNHPNGSLGLNPFALDSKDYGLRLMNETFNFKTVTLSVDSVTGIANMTGTMEHLQSGDIWSLNTSLDLIGFNGTFASQATPYAGMFDDLLAKKTISESESIVYNQNQLTITPVGVVDPVDGFSGPRDWKGAPLHGNDLYVSYRHRLDPLKFPSPDWDLLALNGWWVPTDAKYAGLKGDILAVIDPNPVPEPMTMALMGLGFTGMGAIRRRRKK